MKKTIGVIGGMGPLATVKLFEKIVLKTDAKTDQEHLHILIDNNTLIADRTSYILNGEQENPLDELIISAKKLQSMGADFLIMPCNTAHYFVEDIRKGLQIPLLNMLEETARYIIENYDGTKRLGLLATEGTYSSKVYNKLFEQYGLEIIVPSKKYREELMNLIYGIKKGTYDLDLNIFYEIAEEFKEQDVNLSIIGCTELSFANEYYKLKGNFVDAMDVIVRKSIEYAGAKIKPSSI